MHRVPDKLKSLLQISSLLLWALCGSQFASAQSGSSLPTFSGDTLTIPRIDVEGYGSLELQLQLVDATNLTFQLTSSLAANPSLTPSATYDLQTSVLRVPMVQADTVFYKLDLQLQPGEVFTVVSATETKLTGQDDYNAQCASCHGVDGQGGLVSVSLVNCANCNSISTLSNYIANVMPIGAPVTAPAKPQNIFLTCFR